MIRPPSSLIPRDPHPSSLIPRSSAFTLIELLVVISIIIILMGLLFPAFKGAQTQAKNVQAKNDVTQITAAVNACYTEYGKYPVLSDTSNGTYDQTNNDHLFNILRGVADQGEQLSMNPRRIVFIQVPVAKDVNNPRSGLAQGGAYQYKWVDPWGYPYLIRMDYDYDGVTVNPYSSGAGWSDIGAGVIAWSLGSNGRGGSGDKNSSDSTDDILSWQ